MSFDPLSLNSTAAHASSSPRVSVAVPSYNHASFVAACLRSIFHQTYTPCELVVVDDGSTDESVQVIERTLLDCPFPCEFVARENRGLCRTLNEAFARTDGDYFAYIGSDDLWLPDFLEARVSMLEARPAAVLGYGHAYSIDAHNHIIDCTTDWAAYVDGDARRMLLTTLAPLSPTVLYRRRAIEHHRWNEQAQLEDYELYLRLSIEGEFAFDSRVLSAWRQHSSNTSGNLRLMGHERLAAQERIAESLGIGADELARFRALANFRNAEEFMRNGEKRTALKIAGENLRGIPSAAALARFAASVFLPHRFLRRRKARMRRHAQARYGSLRL